MVTSVLKQSTHISGWGVIEGKQACGIPQGFGGNGQAGQKYIREHIMLQSSYFLALQNKWMVDYMGAS